MPNIHAITDEIVRNRVDLINNLNKLHIIDPKAAYFAYTLCLQQMSSYFDGSKQNTGEDVEEKGNIEP